MTTIPVDACSAYERLAEVTHLFEIRSRIFPIKGDPIEVKVLLDIRGHAARLLDDVDRMIAEIQGGPSPEARLRHAVEAMAGAIAAAVKQHAARMAPSVDAGATTRRHALDVVAPPGPPASVAAGPPPTPETQEPSAMSAKDRAAKLDEMDAVAPTDAPPFPEVRPTRRTTDLTPEEEMETASHHPLGRPGSRPRPASAPAIDDDLFGDDDDDDPDDLAQFPPSDAPLFRDPKRPYLYLKRGPTDEEIDAFVSKHVLIPGPDLYLHSVLLGKSTRLILRDLASTADMDLDIWIESRIAKWYAAGCPKPKHLGIPMDMRGAIPSVDILLPEDHDEAVTALVRSSGLFPIDVLRALSVEGVVDEGRESDFGLQPHLPRIVRGEPPHGWLERKRYSTYLITTLTRSGGLRR